MFGIILLTLFEIVYTFYRISDNLILIEMCIYNEIRCLFITTIIDNNYAVYHGPQKF